MLDAWNGPLSVQSVRGDARIYDRRESKGPLNAMFIKCLRDIIIYIQRKSTMHKDKGQIMLGMSNVNSSLHGNELDLSLQ